MSTGSEVKQIVSSLREQGWEVTLSNDKYRAAPPDKSKKIVVFAAVPSGAHAVVSITRELRQSGFEWPPPKRASNGNIAAVLPIHQSTPFAPKPHPEVSTVENDDEETETPPPPASMTTPAARPSPDADEDVLYLELKEARALVDLAAHELLEKKSELTRAQTAYDTAAKEYEKTLIDLRDKKRAFDDRFDEKDKRA